jgi:hypothetical protein
VLPLEAFRKGFHWDRGGTFRATNRYVMMYVEWPRRLMQKVKDDPLRADGVRQGATVRLSRSSVRKHSLLLLHRRAVRRRSWQTPAG